MSAISLWDNRSTMHRRDSFDPARAGSCIGRRLKARSSCRMRIGKLGAPTVVLALPCAMYFLYFVDRVSISPQPLIKRISRWAIRSSGPRSRLLRFLCFVPVDRGWIGDRLGPRLTLALAAHWWESRFDRRDHGNARSFCCGWL
jgi:hypothetical protein